MHDAVVVLLCAVLEMTLIAAPGVAAALYAGRRGLRDVVTLLAIGLVASGASGMLALWAYFSVHGLGLVVSFTIPAVSGIVIVWCAAHLGRRFPWRGLATPMALWALGTLFLLCFGFLHGGVEFPIQMASNRFSHQLPSDNWLPLYFSNWIYKLGNFRAPPPLGIWLSSDRPPLQMGYVLAARPFGWSASGISASGPGSNTIHYQVLCVALQQLWIVGMCALLDAARVRAGTRWMILTATLVSDVAIVHGFYVWPKLIAVSFLLMAAALILTDRWSTTRSKPGMGILVGSLFALAMLSHGSSVYGVIPLVLLAALRGLPTRRWIGAALLAAAVLYLPWSAYQHFTDPPGNHLEKSFLAGDHQVDKRPVLDTIVDAYSKAGVGHTIDNKLRNLNAVTGGTHGIDATTDAIRLAATGHLDEAIVEMRAVRFYSLVENLGVFALAFALIPMLRVRYPVRSRADWALAMSCFAFVALACTAWVIIQFGDTASPAFIHVASLAVPVVAIIGSVAGLAAISRRIAAIFVGVNTLLVLVLYTPALTPLAGTSFSYVFAVGALACLAGFVFTALRSPCPDQSSWRQGDRPFRAVELDAPRAE